MKNFKNFKTGHFFMAALFAGFVFFASCSNDESVQPDETTKAARSFQEAQPAKDVSLKSVCPDDVTNNGCIFVSGMGNSSQNQFTMVGMLNNCKTEEPPLNCGLGATELRTIDVDFSPYNCDDAATLNAYLNGINQQAINARPTSDFIITGYQRVRGYMVTAYGPYRMELSFTYRKKVCSGTPSGPIHN